MAETEPEPLVLNLGQRLAEFFWSLPSFRDGHIGCKRETVTWEIRIFFIVALALAYAWIGYPLLLWVFRIFKRRTINASGNPTFSIVIAVHNEETQIGAKIEDCLAQRYGSEAVEIIVASDGSTDATDRIVQEWAARNGRIRLLKTQGRAGKSGAQNLAVEQARGEILLFTDAESRMRPDLLQRIAANFGDAGVGLVAPVVQFGRFEGAVSQGQGAYWGFEVCLRQMESDLGILATASGSAFALRRNLFRTIPVQFGDDCVVPIDVRLQGFTIVQDPHALVSDEMPHSVEDELRGRIRMTARNWSGIFSRPAMLNPWRFPGTAWGLVSHKLLRWMTPFFLTAAFVANGLLAGRAIWFTLLLLLQIGFYAAAAVGWRRSRRQHCEAVFGYPFAFCLANLGFLLGIVRSVRGQTVIAYK